MTYLMPSLTVLALLGCGAQQAGPTFTEARIEVGAAPGTVLPVDVNQDQALDLVVANHDTDYVTLLFGSADGFQRRSDSEITVDVSPHPHRVAVADVDVDGHLDFLVDDPEGQALRIYRGRGDGTFVEADPIRLRANPFYGIAVSDLNADGHLDVGTADGVAVGDATGSFSPGPDFRRPGPPPFGVATADVNGDGIPDVGVGSGQRESTFAIWLGTGEGSFRREPTAVHPIAAGPSRVVVSDVDGNGTDDFLVTSYTGNELTILLGGEYELRTSRIEVEGNPWAVATGDFNGDGRMDIATANQSTNDVSILLAER